MQTMLRIVYNVSSTFSLRCTFGYTWPAQVVCFHCYCTKYSIPLIIIYLCRGRGPLLRVAGCVTALRVKGISRGLDFCHSATCMSQTRDQQRFIISEVAVDWHEPMVPQRIIWLYAARANGQLDCWTNGAANRHTIAPPH